MVGSLTYYMIHKKEEKSRKGSKLCWQENQICRKQLKSQEITGKTSRNNNNKAEQEIKEKLDRSVSNARRWCRSGTPGNARGAPTEHFQQKDICKYVHVGEFFPLTPSLLETLFWGDKVT